MHQLGLNMKLSIFWLIKPFICFYSNLITLKYFVYWLTNFVVFQRATQGGQQLAHPDVQRRQRQRNDDHPQRPEERSTTTLHHRVSFFLFLLFFCFRQDPTNKHWHLRVLRGKKKCASFATIDQLVKHYQVKTFCLFLNFVYFTAPDVKVPTRQIREASAMAHQTRTNTLQSGKGFLFLFLIFFLFIGQNRKRQLRSGLQRKVQGIRGQARRRRNQGSPLV